MSYIENIESREYINIFIDMEYVEYINIYNKWNICNI